MIFEIVENSRSFHLVLYIVPDALASLSVIASGRFFSLIRLQPSLLRSFIFRIKHERVESHGRVVVGKETKEVIVELES